MSSTITLRSISSLGGLFIQRLGSLSGGACVGGELFCEDTLI